MIRFFRQIRRELLHKKRLRRYFLYAFGEIILVMIGILLALQINNWNEKRKLELLGKELLGELIINLHQDLKDISANINFHNKSIHSARILLQAFEGDIPQNDSFYIHFGQVPLTPPFLTTESAYYNLKDNGIRILKNVSLRNSITEYYEKHLVFAKKLADSEWNTMIDDYNSLYREKFRESMLRPNAIMIPQNFNALKKDRKYRNYLTNRIGILQSSINNYGGLKTRIENIIMQIEKELAH